MPGVAFFHYGHTPIPPQFPRKLPAPNIDRINLLSAVLQQAIGKPARGSAEINRRQSSHLELKVLERMFQLEASAADKLFLFAERDFVALFDQIARLMGEL